MAVQIQKEKSKQSGKDKQAKADEETATAEFNDAADKKAAESRERTKEVSSDTAAFLKRLDKVLGP